MLVLLNTKSANVFDYAVINVGNRACIIDLEDVDRIAKYKWYIKKSRFCEYAVRKKREGGHEFLIYMHRQITHCPNTLIVHHKNHCTLDNRKANLELMTSKAHKLIHQFF